jgi:hypothetical protein
VGLKSTEKYRKDDRREKLGYTGPFLLSRVIKEDGVSQFVVIRNPVLYPSELWGHEMEVG